MLQLVLNPEHDETWPTECHFDDSNYILTGYLSGYVVDSVTAQRRNGVLEGPGLIHFAYPHDGDTMECEYRNNKRNGPAALFDHNGLCKLSCVYKDNYIEGKGEIYEDGLLLFAGEFSRSDRHGIGSEYDKDGSYLGDCYYQHGNRLNASITYDEEGRSYISLYDDSNILIYMGSFNNQTGEPNGKGTRFYADGSVRDVCLFSNGSVSMILKQFDGTTMKEYDRHGEIVYEGEYEVTEEGHFYRCGEGTEYDGNRKVIYKGQYNHNQRDGVGKEFEDGMCVYDGEFHKGLREGEGRSFGRGGILEYSGYWKKNEKVDSTLDSTLSYGYYPDSASSVPYGYVLHTDGSFVPAPEVSSPPQVMNPSPMMIQSVPSYPPVEPLSNPYGGLPYGVVPQDISYPYGYYPPSDPYSNGFYPQPMGQMMGQITESVPMVGAAFPGAVASTGSVSMTLAPPTASFVPIPSSTTPSPSLSQSAKSAKDSNHMVSRTIKEPTPKPAESKPDLQASSMPTQSVPVTASPMKKPSSRLLPPPPSDFIIRDTRTSQSKQDKTDSILSKSKLTSDMSTRPPEQSKQETVLKQTKSKPISEVSSPSRENRPTKPKQESVLSKPPKTKPTTEVPSASNEQPKEQLTQSRRKNDSVPIRKSIKETSQVPPSIPKKDTKKRFNSENDIHSVSNDEDFNWDDFFSDSSSDSESYSAYNSSSDSLSSSSSSFSQKDSIKRIPPPLPSKSTLRERGVSVDSVTEEPHRGIRSDSKSAPAVPPKVRPPLPMKPSLPAKPTRPAKPVPSSSPSMEMRNNLDELYGAVMQCVTVEEMERAFIFFKDLRTRSNYVIVDEIQSFFQQLNRAKFVLQSILQLVDPTETGQIHLREFALVTHLCYLWSQGFPIPKTLPDSLTHSLVFKFVSDEYSDAAFTTPPYAFIYQDPSNGRFHNQYRLTPTQRPEAMNVKELKRGEVAVTTPTDLTRLRENPVVFFCSDGLNTLDSLILQSYQHIRHIIVGNSVGKVCLIFKITKLPELESIVIGEDSFTQSQRSDTSNPFTQKDRIMKQKASFIISSCPLLQSVTIGNGSFSDFVFFRMEDLPSLQNLCIGHANHKDSYNNRSYSFFGCSDLELISTYLYNDYHTDLPLLQTIEMGNYSFYHCQTAVFKDLPAVTECTFGNYSFFHCASLTLHNLSRLKDLTCMDFSFYSCTRFMGIETKSLTKCTFDIGTFYRLEEISKRNISVSLSMELNKERKRKPRATNI